MKKVLTVLGLVLAFAFVSNAQEKTTPVTIGTTQGCKTSVVVCYAIPVTIPGTPIVTMSLYETEIFFYDTNHALVMGGSLTRQVTKYNSLYQPIQYTISYTVSGDPDENGDTDQIAGGFVMNVTWKKGCGVRWCGWLATVTGGSGAQSVTQD